MWILKNLPVELKRTVLLLLLAGVVLFIPEVIFRQVEDLVTIKFRAGVEVGVGLLASIAEAFVVAALLAISVDSYLKKTLVDDLSSKVIDKSSTYLMSFGMPRDLQNE